MLSALSGMIDPTILIAILVGLSLGFVVGALPGFEASNAAALLLPLSLTLPLTAAVAGMAAVYAGSQFGGAVPAILFNVPGSPGAAATARDGYPLTQQGRGGFAIGVARAGSAISGVFIAIGVLLLFKPLSKVTLLIGSPETFLLIILSLFMITGALGDRKIRGLISALLGFSIAAMSLSPHTGEARLTFGFTELYGSVPFVPVIVGLFGIAEMLRLMSNQRNAPDTKEVFKESVWSTRELLGDSWDGIKYALRKPWIGIRSGLLGLSVGIIPGIGPTVANFAAYDMAKRSSSDPNSFGKGNPDGVLASEAADNAAMVGTMVPTLALGIPGSATAGIMLAAFYLQGATPGPQLLETHSDVVYTILGALVLSSLLILPIGIVLAVPLVRLVLVPPKKIVPAVILLCMTAAVAVRGSAFDLGLATVIGVIGYFMIRADFPVVPVVLGVLLGPIAENSLIRSMAIGQNDVSIFWQSPTSMVLCAVIILLVVQRIVSVVKSRKRALVTGP